MVRNRRRDGSCCSKKTQIVSAVIFVPILLAVITVLVLIGLGMINPQVVGKGISVVLLSFTRI